jgi:hypothetical protein
MKYMEKGGFKHNPLMRLTLSLVLLFLVFFWLTNFSMYFMNMNLRPQSVVDYYLGTPDGFSVPKTYEGLALTSHFHFPMMASVILLLTHLVIFVPWPRWIKVTLIATAFMSAFFQELSSWLVRFVHPAWAWVKVLSFMTLQVVMFVLLASLAAYLWFWDRQNLKLSNVNGE